MMEVRMNQTTRVGVISAGIWNSDLKWLRDRKKQKVICSLSKGYVN
jgi:hypothetical protein